MPGARGSDKAGRAGRPLREEGQGAAQRRPEAGEGDFVKERGAKKKAKKSAKGAGGTPSPATTRTVEVEEEEEGGGGGGITLFGGVAKPRSSSGGGAGPEAAAKRGKWAGAGEGEGGASKGGGGKKRGTASPGGGEQADQGRAKGAVAVVKGLLGGEDEERSFGALGVEDWLVRSCESMGLTRPTDVQWNCIPPALKGRNIMASAKTGSGKTAAFALPILQSLSRDPFGVYAVVLTPTRELAFQIRDQFAALGASMQLKEYVVVGGMDMMAQAQALCRRPHVVIATPGRLADHVKSSHGVRDALRRVGFVVFDEADRLLEECFAPHLAMILDAIPAKRTTMLFSATITHTLEDLKDMSLKDCFQYRADDPTTTVDTVEELYCHMPATIKDCYLVHILRESDAPSLIVFTATRQACQYVSLLLEELGEGVAPLHSGLKQSRRLASLDRFKSGRCRALVATDVASRGLDIPTVGLVVNYDVPRVPTDYIHRVGRTARAGRRGTAVSLVTQYDVGLLQAVEAHTGKQVGDYGADEEQVLELMGEVMKGRRVAKVKMLEADSEGQDQRRRGGLKRKTAGS